jgi:hypothetical protein
MSFRQVARRQWSHFLESFSGRHLGLPCTLEVHFTAPGTGVEACRAAFQGLVYEPARAVPMVQIFVGDRPDVHMTRTLASPVSVWVDEDGQGRVWALRIDGDRGSLVLRLDPEGGAR